MGLFRSKPNSSSLNTKLLFLSLFLAFILFIALRSNFSISSPILTSTKTATEGAKLQTSSSSSSSTLPTVTEPSSATIPTSASSSPEEKTECPPPNNQPCTKLPAPVMEVLIHYATSNITPQQTLKEVSVTSKVLQKKGPCNFLVFGLGHDSPLWSTLNHGGRTVFLEEDESWIRMVTKERPGLEVYRVGYDTKVKDAEELLRFGQQEECTAVTDPRESGCRLSLKGLPDQIYEAQWDLIMVDAPTGYHENAPGRMTAIYTAGLMARNRKDGGSTDVFVHDVDRVVEDKYSMAFLCEWYMKQQEGRLRHFTIPSQRTNLGSFCP
ncbi:unnamed protein product [Victoria cruziana]